MTRLLAVILWLLPYVLVAQRTPVDSIYFNGVIVTGNALDSANPERVSALAITDGRILVSGDDAGTLRLRTAQTKLIDLHGAFVMPGFNDAHVHLAAGGRTKLAIDLTGTTSLDDMRTRIRTAAAIAPSGTWLTGSGWDHTLWSTKRLPTRADLDSVTGGHPAVFTRIDGHIALANSAALNAADINRKTADTPGGKIDRDDTGQLTGILRETAMRLVSARVPSISPPERRQALELALADAVHNGLTSVQDNSDWEDFIVLEQLEREGKLPIRVTEWLPFDAPIELLNEHRAHHAAADPMLHTGMLKGFMDGSLGSRTAAMKAPYADDPGNSGIPRYDQETLNTMTAERVSNGFQIGFHAIGDRAVAMALTAFASAPPSGLRFRIEHDQVVDPPDLALDAKLHVIASMQPNHLLTDMSWAEARLGPERAKTSYAWKEMLDHGIALCFGTDYPVEPVTPFRGLYAAITRQNEAATQTYFPEQKLTIQQALYAYTQGSAYAENAETVKGKLTSGYWADFVVLDRDLTAVSPRDILKTRVLKTVVNGRENW